LKTQIVYAKSRPALGPKGDYSDRKRPYGRSQVGKADERLSHTRRTRRSLAQNVSRSRQHFPASKVREAISTGDGKPAPGMREN